ncbi:MAG: hypothetical protein WCE21_03720 [Candidatus Babeliales bacterium]
MVLIIPSAGALILALLLAFLFLGAPVGSVRSLVLTLINILVFVLLVYVLLVFFGVIAVM